ncbi:heterodisulfide reductase-related iron-sulfur binding cluster [Dehalococcoidia bacterium]|nr:heterodisulfide reductase-related iron-sulfur binding cluster [Dehalococcoidia bacterium]
MTSTEQFGTSDNAFWDEQALLVEERRQFDVCHGCRLCFSFCPAFPILFDQTDNVDGDLSKLNKVDFGKVEANCYQCKLCFVRCPYTPPHHFNLNIPRLMTRAKFISTRKQGLSLTDRIMANTDLTGKLGSWTAPLSNRANKSIPIRFVLEKVAGIHRKATLPKFHKKSFSSWFRMNQELLNANLPQNAPKVALFYTCQLNHADPEVAIATTQVLNHNGVRVAVPQQQCCGMPFADSGALPQTLTKIRANVATLSSVIQQGYDVVIPSPSCSLMIKQEYPELLPTEESKLVAKHAFDTSEYLWQLRGQNGLNTNFPNSEFTDHVKRIAYHVPCHIRAQFMGNKSANLMELIPGITVEQIEQCSHHDGTWGIRKDSHQKSLNYAEKLFRSMRDTEADLFATDCPLAASQIEHGILTKPVHPIQVLKEAYGIQS